jgi:Rrf2 family nitric oxide-sensitive transcriptional repressor
MQLTRHTDYSLRVLTYVALRPDEMTNVAGIAAALNINKNHLVKVVNNLSRLGYIETTRGRGGGIRLARAPERIKVGEIVRLTENTLDAINCTEPYCPILPGCQLKSALEEATDAFLGVLDGYSVADLVRRKSKLIQLLG